WKYLGWKITDQHIQPQKITIDVEIKTLHDAQRLLGDLQWLRPVVGIPNDLMEELRPLLKGTDPAAK
ncbi:PO113 protein, partial [Falcunculus frontatus]|nr:PO113 protein [Falcunculus frontatus]